jgi:hypothetical protein
LIPFDSFRTQGGNVIYWPNFAIDMPKNLKFEIICNFRLLVLIAQALEPAGTAKMSEFRAKGVSTSANGDRSLKMED